jgi:SAM-dependent methyltransferase
MSPKTPDRQAQRAWDDSYVLTSSDTLWGQPPVPFVTAAIDIFRDMQAACVLDVPCGDGRNLVPLARSLPFVVGGDSSSRALTLTQQRLAEASISNGLLLRLDISEMPFATDNVPAVFCWDLIGHLRDPHHALEECLRVCRPGGIVIGSVFATGDPVRGINMRQIGDDEYVFDNRFYFRFYSEHAVQELLASHPRAEVTILELTRWSEPAHEGYREYEHEHESWAFALRKRSAT